MKKKNVFHIEIAGKRCDGYCFVHNCKFLFFLLTEIRKLLIISKVKFYNYLQGLLVNIFHVFFLKF